MQIRLYHNPRCSKSRQTLELLEERGTTPTVIRYLDTPPGVDELRELAETLGIRPRELLRSNEAPYEQLDLDDPGKSDDEILAAISANPVLLQRPIVVNGRRARIGRPPEAVLEILD